MQETVFLPLKLWAKRNLLPSLLGLRKHMRGVGVPGGQEAPETCAEGAQYRDKVSKGLIKKEDLDGDR